MLSLSLPIDSWAHRRRVGEKLLVLAVISVLAFPLANLIHLSLLSGFVIVLYLSIGRAACVQGLRMLKPLIWVVAIMLGYHLLVGNFVDGLRFVIKMASLVALANFVTMTSRMDDMMETLLWMLGPIKQLGVNTAAIALAFALVVRFTPVLIAKASDLMQSWRARSARRVNWRIVMPLFLVALDDADHVSDALRARGGTPET